MYSFLLRARHSNTFIIIITILVFFVIGLLAEFYNYYRINQNYKKEVAHSSEKLIHKLNYVFDEANNITHTIILMKDTSCQAEEYSFKKIVATSNIVRSATLTHNNAIYCSSIYELIQKNYVNVKRYLKEPLNLFESNHLTPNSPVITYSLTDGDWGAFVGIQGKIIVDILQTSEFNKESFLVINNKLISADNTVSLKEDIKVQKWLSYNSKKYPFKIIVDTTVIKNSYQATLSFIILTIVLLITAITTFIYIAITATKRDFKRAIVENQLIPYYQLVISTSDYTWHGLEVLTRWQHPKHGIITPNKFIGLAEKTKLIIPMTQKLMARVANELIPYIYSLPKPFHVGFNVHASHLNDPGLINDCQKFLDAFPPNTINLVLEITESQFVQSSAQLEDLLNKFHDMGVRISIDDFGTGYSNLGYLQRYKVDHLKIDRIFVSTIYKKTTSSCLLDTIIGLAKNMNLGIVAEGVETLEQLQYLSNQGVEYIQGFLFNRPAPIEYTIKSLLKPCQAPSEHHQFSIFVDNI